MPKYIGKYIVFKIAEVGFIQIFIIWAVYTVAGYTIQLVSSGRYKEIRPIKINRHGGNSLIDVVRWS